MTSIEVARSRKLLSAISPGKKARLSGDKSKTDRARWQAGMGVAVRSKCNIFSFIRSCVICFSFAYAN